jgi:hypothetical protein
MNASFIVNAFTTNFLPAQTRLTEERLLRHLKINRDIDNGSLLIK